MPENGKILLSSGKMVNPGLANPQLLIPFFIYKKGINFSTFYKKRLVRVVICTHIPTDFELPVH